MLIKIDQAIQSASKSLLSLQHPEGYWWFTLEANGAIDAGYIQLMHFLEALDPEIQSGLVRRILQEQREDGSWGLYYGSAGDLNTTVECYFSLRLAGFSQNHPALTKARDFILSKGGLTKARVFTRIHLALFGLVPWEACPSLPLSMMFLPPWAPLNIYNFSSWARASIVPLLVILNQRPQVNTPIHLEELFSEPEGKRKWSFAKGANPLSLERLFLLIDKGLKYIDKVPYKPWKGLALEKAIAWIWEHLQKTNDIYPALAYGAMAFKACGYSNDSIQIQTCLSALKSFQQKYVGPELPPISFEPSTKYPSAGSGRSQVPSTIHQQCCVSPVWDTPWSMVALVEADPKLSYDEKLLRAGRWLLSKEIQNPKGDWCYKNPEGKPGGWSFEFLNEYFPDTDDTIEVLTALWLLNLPESEKKPAIERGLAWLLSMQNDDGGFGAFDKNNDLELVNKIPFSDHGACLDPSSPDITGRALELLLKLKTPSPSPLMVQYLKQAQESFGGWYGRWGVNYIYGTWAVLTGLAEFGEGKNPLARETQKACEWLVSIQNKDGGFSESPQSYQTKRYHPYPQSVPSQTAWAVMALIAGGQTKSQACQRGIDFLIKHGQGGVWEEKYFTGTGFPEHFYIRYHGYRYYFPLLALARYRHSCESRNP